jgi:divinyl chlorophyllide a 8-vinyl-reductase
LPENIAATSMVKTAVPSFWLGLAAASTLWCGTTFTPVAAAFAVVVPTTTQPARTTRQLYAEKKTTPTRTQKTAVIAGATGYIGRSVVREAVRQGYETYALVRDAKNAPKGRESFFQGAHIVECDVTNREAVMAAMQQITNNSSNVDAIFSCLASRSGTKRDAYLIDYQATLHCLQAGEVVGAKHFVLLSAFCCKNPWLQFQKAKLQFEAALQNQTSLTYSVVRPTAFFKSVSGQLEVVQAGSPYVGFGNGEITRCNPIAESDLATYLVDCVDDPSRHGRIINLGGPDEPLTMKMQGAMLFNATGMEPKYIFAPVWIFDVVINALQWLADLTGIEALENAAETGRIGKYYAVEDMLTIDPSEKFGTISLQEHYNRIAVEGQEYDPYTTMFSSKRAVLSKEKEVYNKLMKESKRKVSSVTSAIEEEDSAVLPTKY